jgi:hypothetical protein
VQLNVIELLEENLGEESASSRILPAGKLEFVVAGIQPRFRRRRLGIHIKI